MSDKYFIDKTSLRLLRLYSKRETLSIKNLGVLYNSDCFSFAPPINYLIKKGYLEIHPDHVMFHGSDLATDAPLRITYEGKVLLEAELNEHRKFIFREFRNWLALVIAIISLILSIAGYA